MSKQVLRLALISFFVWIGAAVPARAALVEVGGQGNAFGTVTTYTCTEPGDIIGCPFKRYRSSWSYSIDEWVNTDALATGPAHFEEQVGVLIYEDFDVALLGTDRWGNYVFQGQNLSIGGAADVGCHGDLPCTFTYYDFALATFPLHQIYPAPLPYPEPGTWTMMLTGFGAVGWMMHRGRKQRRNSNQQLA